MGFSDIIKRVDPNNFYCVWLHIRALVRIMLLPLLISIVVATIAHYAPIYISEYNPRKFGDIASIFLNRDFTDRFIEANTIQQYRYFSFAFNGVTVFICSHYILNYKVKLDPLVYILLICGLDVSAHLLFIFWKFEGGYARLTIWSLLSIGALCAIMGAWLFVKFFLENIASIWVFAKAFWVRNRRDVDFGLLKTDATKIENFIADNRKRASQLRGIGYAILLFMVIFIISIGIVLVSVNKLFDTATSATKKLEFVSLRDFRQRDRLQELQRQEARLEEERSILEQNYTKTNERLNQKEIDAKSTQTDQMPRKIESEEINDLQNELIQQKARIDALKIDIDNARISEADIRDELKGYKDFALNIGNKDKQLTEGNEFAFFSVSATATRIGILVVSIFLMRFFVQIYQYNSRLAAYCDSRANLAMLSTLNTVAPEILSDLIWKDLTFSQTDGQDFEKSSIELMARANPTTT